VACPVVHRVHFAFAPLLGAWEAREKVAETLEMQ
jgi:hypothetical protein